MLFFTFFIQGKKRFKIDSIVEEKPYIKAKIKDFIDDETDKKNTLNLHNG